MDDVALLWKGGTEPTSFPHLCPYRQPGAEKQVCIDLGGTSYQQNLNGCCGTQRGKQRFLPCNSIVRRCIVCLEKGRRGLKANAVTNVRDGTCDEHAKGAPAERSASEFRLPATPQRRAMPVDAGRPLGTAEVAPTRAGPDLGKKAAVVVQRADQATEPLLGEKAHHQEPLLGRKAEEPRWRAVIARVRKAIAEAELVKLPPERFRPMPGQPRDYFDPEELGALEESIIEVGQIQDGMCRPVSPDGKGSDYELLDGERRWRCVTRSGAAIYRAKCVVIDDEAAPYVIAAISNFNRSDHTPMEKSNAIERLLNGGLKVPVGEIAKMLGIGVNTVYKLHTLQKLPQEVKDMLDPRLHKGRKEDLLPLVAGYELARLTDPVHREYAKDLGRRVLVKQLSLPKLRVEVDRILVRSGHARSTRERLQPARQFKFVERQINIMFVAMEEMKQRIKDMKQDRTLPDDARRIDTDMNRLIRDVKECIVLVGGVLYEENT